MGKFRLKIFFILFTFLNFFFLSFADEFKITITGYEISLEGDKTEQFFKIIKSFPLKEEKDIYEIVKNIDENFVVKKEFTFSFNLKENSLMNFQPETEWGRIDLEIKIVPNSLNNVIVEYDIKETPKWWEDKTKKMARETAPKTKFETKNIISFELGKINLLSGVNIQKEFIGEGKVKTFTNLRTILIEKDM